MRLFIGIDLPDSIKQKIHHHLRPIQLGPKGWEDPHDYHQTLLFIGEATSQELESIKQRMGKIHFPTFQLETNGFKFFNRRIIYLSFKASEELLRLKTRIDDNFPEWHREGAKEFIPHITVKRWQRYEHEHLVQRLQESEFQELKFEVNKLSLFLSRKDELNRKYHVIHSVDLGIQSIL